MLIPFPKRGGIFRFHLLVFAGGGSKSTGPIIAMEDPPFVDVPLISFKNLQPAVLITLLQVNPCPLANVDIPKGW